jgi:hypothetical protein
MTFATDRDLLVLEPTLFNDVPFVTQQRLKHADGALDGVTLTSAAADFETAGINVGAVLLLDATPVEVIEQIDSHTLTVSGVRDAREGDAVAPLLDSGAESGIEIIHRTYGPQLSLVHGTLLRMIGINPDDPSPVVTADMILSVATMRGLEVLGALELIFSSAYAAVGDYSNLREKAQQYRDRFRQMSRSARIEIDVDGDGRCDFTQWPGVMRLVRV